MVLNYFLISLVAIVSISCSGCNIHLDSTMKKKVQNVRFLSTQISLPKYDQKSIIRNIPSLNILDGILQQDTFVMKKITTHTRGEQQKMFMQQKTKQNYKDCILHLQTW